MTQRVQIPSIRSARRHEILPDSDGVPAPSRFAMGSGQVADESEFRLAHGTRSQERVVSDEASVFCVQLAQYDFDARRQPSRRVTAAHVIGLDSRALRVRACFERWSDDNLQLEFAIRPTGRAVAWGQWQQVEREVFDFVFRRKTVAFLALVDAAIQKQDTLEYLRRTLHQRVSVRNYASTPTSPTQTEAVERISAEPLALGVIPGKCAQHSRFFACRSTAARVCDHCLKPICRDHTRTRWNVENFRSQFSRNGLVRAESVDANCFYDVLCGTCVALQKWAGRPLAIVSEQERRAFLYSDDGQSYRGEWERDSIPYRKAF